MKKLDDHQVRSMLKEHNFDLVESYKNGRTPLVIKCARCESITHVRLADFKNGVKNDCKNCNSLKITRTCTGCGYEKSISDFSLKGLSKNTRCKKCVAQRMVEYNHKTGRSKTYAGQPRKDICGKRFGKLVVIENLGTKSNKHRLWLCKCDCGNTKNVYHTHLVRGLTKTCGCGYRGSDNFLWKGCGEISGGRWDTIKRKRRHSESRLFEISIKEAWNLFLEQERKCALSGIELEFGKTNKDKFTASLDRIDSSKGYTLDNVQWVHKDINRMKNVFSQEYFIETCKAIALNS